MAANPVDSIDIFNRQPVDLETLLSNASTPRIVKSLEDQKRDDNRSFLDKTVEGYEEGVPLPAQIALGFTVPAGITCTKAVMSIETAAIRVACDGTAATATNGVLVTNAQGLFVVHGLEAVANY